MPNIWTHNLFGLEIIKNAGFSPLPDTPYLTRIFQLGCQGPDFLFYHHFLPWQKDKTMSELGGVMHKRSCGPALAHMVRYMKERGKTLRDPEALYVIGFLLHHVLDRNMHPYVFYKSGFKKWDHQRFEVVMDTIAVRQKLGLQTWKTPVWKQLDIGPALPAELTAMFESVKAAFFPEFAARIAPEQWNEAYRAMVRAQKIFHDPYGVKRLLTFGQIEPLVYKRKNAPLDYMNEARAPWHDPTSMELVYNDSVWDLWAKAAADGLAVVQSAAAYLDAPDGAAEERYARFCDCLGDYSYETGKPTDSGSEIRFADPIWQTGSRS